MRRSACVCIQPSRVRLFTRSRPAARPRTRCRNASGARASGSTISSSSRSRRGLPRFPQAVQVVSEAGRANGGVLVDALHLSRTGGTREDVRQTPAHSCVMPSRNDHPPTRPSSRKRAQIACCQAAAHCRCAISWTCSRPRRSYRSRCRRTVPPQPSSMCGTYSWRRRSCSPPAAPKTMRIAGIVATERGHLLAQL